jgi:DNA polymerase
MDFTAKKDVFLKINTAVIKCSKCRLCKNRKNAVPGEGNINADIVFIGEAPGAKEDELGRPFVGRSGMMLNELLQKIGLTRRDVWIGNVIKCRPPENRDPMVDEIRACRPYLDKQIELIDPKIVVTLGRFAMDYFLPGEKIANAHGNPYMLKTRVVYPLYHPAAALRNGTIKQVLIKDFINLKKILNTDFSSINFVNATASNKDEDEIALF